MKLNTGKLGGWIASWIQPDGAIHGFHNHSVWGGNPYRWTDFSSGHSTWASPFLAGLSLALRQHSHVEGLALLKKLIRYQTQSFHEDGQYDHIGFQVGDSLKVGLIHNAITNVSLGLTALHGRDYLDREELESIRSAIVRNMEACRRYGNEGRPDESATCNQDYARIWAKLIFHQAFGDDRWKEEVLEDLAFMIEHFHVSGLPDADSAGTYRTFHDKSAVEPAEYYGLIILPLVLAYEVYGDESYLDQAGAICRHVARSAWTDSAGYVRFHRLWYRQGETWYKNESPMLIAGMGDSLNGILRYLEHRNDSELAAFLDRCDETYAAYQTPRGYLVSATGWQSEVDIAPSSAWHAHDFHYLVARHGTGSSFWEQMLQQDDTKTSVLLGDQCMWVERGNHWSIHDYFWQDVFKLLGRKDEAYFGRDIPAWTGIEERLPDSFTFPQLPVFLKSENGIYLMNDHGQDIEVTSIAAIPYKGKLQ